MAFNVPSLFSRRDFLKLSAAGLGVLSLHRWQPIFALPDFPKDIRLGRTCRPLARVDVKEAPDYNSKTVKVYYEDTVVPWLSQVVGSHPGRNNQRYVETPDGYVWSADIQPVYNRPNVPVKDVPSTAIGKGMWVEVSVPYVDIVLDRPPAAPWIKDRKELGFPLRLYYSQILWVDQVKTDENGQAWYRVNERYGYGDLFWAQAEAFRPLTEEEVAPIHPEAEEKTVVVYTDWKRQYVSCFEGKHEVYFCLVSTGTEDGSTPTGEHTVWRKLISVHMSGGTTNAGYDLPGIGWTTLFVGEGVAFHSTFWHNNFGEPESHGCVNCAPDDAKWIFRWVNPTVSFIPGDLTAGGTHVKVIEG